MNVGVVGSRRGADLDDVRAFMHALFSRDMSTIVVSGGAKGVDTTAECTWLELGGRVVSLRPKKEREGEYLIERWKLVGALTEEEQPDLVGDTGVSPRRQGPMNPVGLVAGASVRGSSSVSVIREPSFADFTSAALYRDMLIARSADRLVAFQVDGHPSSGTAITVGFARDRGVPIYLYTPRERFSA